MLVVVLSTCAFLVLVPCGVSLILASWFALLTRPWMMALASRLNGRVKAAAIVTSMVVIAILGPIILALIPVVSSALELTNEIGQSRQWRDAARSVVGDSSQTIDWMRLMREHVATAWDAVSMAMRASANVLFGAVMFVVSLLAFSTSGEGLVAWLRAHSPLKPPHFDRLARTYAETGRSLLIGMGVTALLQGAVATATYAVVGIPRALPLGLLTMIAALIPAVGTFLVWGPVAVILWFGGYPVKAAVIGLSGVLLIGSVDNFLKPILSNRAHLGMPAVLVFVSMLSGIAAWGAAGLVLGPLFVRMAMEVLEIARAEQWVGAAEPERGRNHATLRRAP